MAIALSANFLAELKKNTNSPNVIIEVSLDSGVQKWGYHTGGFGDVKPILKSVSSLQNKLDSKTGYSTRGQLTLVISGRDNFKSLVANNYLKNRRVTRKDGFIASGFAYSDYAATFTGRISDWSRKGDELTITVSDDLVDASKKIPVENSTKTQLLDFRNMNPVDIMTNILLTQLGIGASYVDSAKFALERDNWLNGWKFDRVITEPKEANDYLNELQQETNSFIVHDGEKISYRVFSPPYPGQAPEEWTDNYNILSGSLSLKSGYKDNFFNRIVVQYDHDESGSDKDENFESALIALDSASQGSAQWNEVKTKTIKSRWIRSRTCTQPTTMGGVTVYHVSRANGTGTGTLTYSKANNTLQWTAPGGAIGEAVKLSRGGKFQLFDADKTKYARVVVNTVSLPGADMTNSITISALDGLSYATALAQKLLSRYRDPSATAALDIDINNVAWNSAFIKPTDIKDITTDEACEKGMGTWTKERVMLTSVRPDFSTHRVSIEAIETKMYRKYGFIAPAGQPDYPQSTDAQREYAYVGDANNRLNAASVDGNYVW